MFWKGYHSHLLKLAVRRFIFCKVYACKKNGVCYYMWNKKRPTHFCVTECCTVKALISSNLFLAQTRFSRHHTLCCFLHLFNYIFVVLLQQTLYPVPLYNFRQFYSFPKTCYFFFLIKRLARLARCLR